MATRRKPDATGRIRADIQRQRAAELSAQGLTGRAIAKKLKVNEDTVSVWLQEAEVQETVEKTLEAGTARARKILEDASIDAAEAVVDMATHGVHELTAKGAAVRLRAAFGVLDRVGLAASTKIETDDASPLSQEELERRAAEILSRKKK